MKFIFLALIKRRLKLKVYPSQKSAEDSLISTIAEGRAIALENDWIDRYEIVEEEYIKFKNEDMILKTTKIENGIRAELLMLEDVWETIKYDDFALVAQMEPTKTILQTRIGMLVTPPTHYTYLIIGKRLHNMFDVIQQKTN